MPPPTSPRDSWFLFLFVFNMHLIRLTPPPLLAVPTAPPLTCGVIMSLFNLLGTVYVNNVNKAPCDIRAERRAQLSLCRRRGPSRKLGGRRRLALPGRVHGSRVRSHLTSRSRAQPAAWCPPYDVLRFWAAAGAGVGAVGGGGAARAMPASLGANVTVLCI